MSRTDHEKDRRNVRKFQPMKKDGLSLEDTMILVWKEALVDDARSVTLEGRTFPVRRTSRSRLREVDFQFEGHNFRGLEQNPETASRWAQLARRGKKVMQFLQQHRYVAVVVDGKAQFYGHKPVSDSDD